MIKKILSSSQHKIWFGRKSLFSADISNFTDGVHPSWEVSSAVASWCFCDVSSRTVFLLNRTFLKAIIMINRVLSIIQIGVYTLVLKMEFYCIVWTTSGAQKKRCCWTYTEIFKFKAFHSVGALCHQLGLAGPKECQKVKQTLIRKQNSPVQYILIIKIT